MSRSYFKSAREWRIGRLCFYCGMQGRGDNGDNPPWLGFYYGSWLPKVRLGRYVAASYADVIWLCFHASFYLNEE